MEQILASLNADGYWLVPLEMNSHRYRGDGPATPVPGDFSETMVGDETDTSPYRDDKIQGISTSAYIRNMSVLIRVVDEQRHAEKPRERK